MMVDFPWTGAMIGDPAERVIAFLKELSAADDMPMHHAADIDQFLVEALGVEA